MLLRRKNRPPNGFNVGASTDVGKTREENQDSFGVFHGTNVESQSDHLFVVADGMGGHERGKDASELAIATLQKEYFRSDGVTIGNRLETGLNIANALIYQKSVQMDDGASMGTTCTALAVQTSAYWLAHIGDSKAYRINQDSIDQLTSDHTFVNELVKEGYLTPEQALHDPRRHNLLQAIGVEPEISPDIFEIEDLKSGDRVLICSDGLDIVPQAQVASIARGKDLQKACDELIDLANKLGGPDNVTLVIVEVP